jgi:membrane protein DedA with SNARE-associated domain
VRVGSEWISLPGFLASVQDAILSLTSSAWIYPSVWAITVIDGVFPPIPSESIVIAAGAAWRVEGRPSVGLVWLVAAFGAWCGDQLAYAIGMTIPIRRVPGMQGPRGVAALARAERALEHRGTSSIIAVRFIPVVRVAFNLTAGALRFPRRRFMAIDAVGAVIWATYSIALGAFAGSILPDSLLASIVIGVVGGVSLGYLVDLILSKVGIRPLAMLPVEELPIEGPIARRRARNAARSGAPEDPKASGEAG